MPAVHRGPPRELRWSFLGMVPFREAVGLPEVEMFVVSCPKDVTMYEDAIKTSGNAERLELRELTELIEEAKRLVHGLRCVILERSRQHAEPSFQLGDRMTELHHPIPGIRLLSMPKGVMPAIRQANIRMGPRSGVGKRGKSYWSSVSKAP